MIGVNYDLFWTLNPKSLNPFIKAFHLKQEYEDSLAWTQGLYIRMAIASCMSKQANYPKQPFSEKAKPQKPITTEDIKERFLVQMEIINSRFNKEDTNV